MERRRRDTFKNAGSSEMSKSLAAIEAGRSGNTRGGETGKGLHQAREAGSWEPGSRAHTLALACTQTSMLDVWEAK